jgi:hypothetical protein
MKRRNKALSDENEINGGKLVIKFLKTVIEDSERGCAPILIRNIPTQVAEEFEKKIMSSPKHHGETVGQARDKEILAFMLRTIEKKE